MQEKLGFLSGYELGGKDFCSRCYDSLSVEEKKKLKGYECKECKFFYVDDNYDSWCEVTKLYTDRNKKACSNFNNIKILGF